MSWSIIKINYTYKMNGKTVEETFGTPYDDDDSEIPVVHKS